MRYWTEEEEALLRRIYPERDTASVAGELGRSAAGVSQRAHGLGVTKSPEYIRRACSRMATCFKKGHVSANKGKRWSDYMSPEGMKASRKTAFKKGHVPHNHVGVGTIVETGGYLTVKTGEPKEWMFLHHLVWQVFTRGWFEKDGIEKGVNIQFRDGNRANCRFDNLYAIRREDQMVRNSASTNLSDGIVAMWLSGKHGRDKEEIALFRQNWELLEAKRILIRLQRAIKAVNSE
jgi:hypothetical protein